MTENERHLIQQFYDWEIWGRGWIKYPQPVALEPPFRSFAYSLPRPRLRNAGQMPTLLSSIGSALTGLFVPKPPEIAEEEEIEEPEPDIVQDLGEAIVEITVSLPPRLAVGKDVFASLVRS